MLHKSLCNFSRKKYTKFESSNQQNLNRNLTHKLPLFFDTSSFNYHLSKNVKFKQGRRNLVWLWFCHRIYGQLFYNSHRMKQGNNNNKQSFGRTNNSITASFHIWLGDFLYDSCQTGQMDDHAMLSHRWEKKRVISPF